MLETNRLVLRPLEKRDVDAIFAMRSDLEVMRFIREPQNRTESVSWIKLVSSRWKTEKIGFCAVIEKRTKDFVGWCGIWRLEETREFEVGYAIAKQYWGNGLATEASLRFLEYAFERLKPDKIVAVARPENAASRRVMEKLGMSFVTTGTFYEQTLVQYALTSDEFFRQNHKVAGTQTIFNQ
ncbi:MAG: GNAT family N-acetyltransferase [Acidobacteriota bacterium]|nr:GNAT family N-acetyltransferase [Acidobacteriota bacterium]